MVSEVKCCHLSLRTATLITLYVNILVNISTLFKAIIIQQDSAYKRIMGEEFSFEVDVFLSCAEMGVYIAAIGALRKKKTFALNSTLFLALLNAYITVCLIYKLYLAENAAAAVNQEARVELEQFSEFFDVELEYLYISGELVMRCVWAVCLTFHLSSAMIVYKYQEELNEFLNVEGPVSHHRGVSSDPPPRYHTVSPIELVSPPPYNTVV